MPAGRDTSLRMDSEGSVPSRRAAKSPFFAVASAQSPWFWWRSPSPHTHSGLLAQFFLFLPWASAEHAPNDDSRYGSAARDAIAWLFCGGAEGAGEHTMAQSAVGHAPRLRSPSC